MHKCPCCEKEFYMPQIIKHQWSYKIKDKIYCSYKCYSQEFNKLFKPSTVHTSSQSLGWKKNR